MGRDCPGAMDSGLLCGDFFLCHTAVSHSPWLSQEDGSSMFHSISLVNNMECAVGSVWSA